MEMRELTLWSVMARILVAFVLGGVLGVERGMKQRPAGLRTYMLVCVGACVIMLTNLYIYQVFAVGDPVRMGAQVVSGIGFLGAGTIVVTKHNQIRGLTTAAGLWAAAAIGLATGVGFYEAAIVGAGVIFATLTVLTYLDDRMHRKTRYFDVYVTLTPTVTMGTLLNFLRCSVQSVEDIHPDASIPGDENRHYFMTLVTKNRITPAELADSLSLSRRTDFLIDIL